MDRSGSIVHQQFTQKERDVETNLDYFLARYYSSTQGRFTSPDPIFISEKRLVSPQSWNLYSYVNNNPLAYLDPTGMERVRLGQHTDEQINARIKAIDEEKKAIRRNSNLTKAEQDEQRAKLETEKKTLGLEKEGNRIARAFIGELNSIGEGQGLQVSDFTLSTTLIADFVTDPEFLRGFSHAQDAFHAAAENSEAFMFVFGGYSTEIFINTSSNGYRGTLGLNSDATAADYITYAGTAAAHERSHRDGSTPQQRSEQAAFTEQLRVLQKFGPGAFRNRDFYDNAVRFVRDGTRRPD